MKTIIESKAAARLALLGTLAVASASAGAMSYDQGGVIFDLTSTTPSPGVIRVLDYGTVPPNPNGSVNDPFLSDPAFSDFSMIDKNDETPLGILDGSGLTNGIVSGSWTLDTTSLTGYSEFALALKSDKEWVVFGLNGATAGTWSIEDASRLTGKELSHAVLYGRTSVPLPAAAWLFGSALLSVFGIGYRRRGQ